MVYSNILGVFDIRGEGAANIRGRDYYRAVTQTLNTPRYYASLHCLYHAHISCKDSFHVIFRVLFHLVLLSTQYY